MYAKKCFRILFYVFAYGKNVVLLVVKSPKIFKIIQNIENHQHLEKHYKYRKIYTILKSPKISESHIKYRKCSKCLKYRQLSQIYEIVQNIENHS